MFFDLSIATADLFAEELMMDRHVKRIVKSLECSRVGVDVLKNTKIQDALSRYGHDDKLGERVRDLLFRFVMIEEGRAEATNDHVESARGWGSRTKVTKKQYKDKKMEIKLVKVTISKVSSNTTQDNRKIRSIFGSTKKVLKMKSTELSLLSLKEAFQKLGL